MKLPIQTKCGVPIYLLLAESICHEIRSGNLKMGDPLPPTRRLAAEHRLNHKTVARTYAELRAQGVAFTSRPTGPYIIMSQTQHIAETQRGHALKIMSAILCAARILRRMPLEMDPRKSIDECLQKLKVWESRLDELNAAIAAKRAKSAHDLPGMISPIGIDEALAAMAALGAPNPSSAREANPLAQKEASEDTPWNDSDFRASTPNPLCSAHPGTKLDTAWNNAQKSSIEPSSAYGQKETHQDSAWNNSGFFASPPLAPESGPCSVP